MCWMKYTQWLPDSFNKLNHITVIGFSGGAVAARKKPLVPKFLIADTAFPCMLVEKVFRILEFGAKSTGTAVVPFDHLVVFLRNKSDTSFLIAN